MCEPGCSPGLFGQDCTTVSVTDTNCPYVVNNATLYQRASTCEPVCVFGSGVDAQGSCVEDKKIALPPPVTLIPPVIVPAPLADDVLAIVLLAVGSAFAVGLFSFAMWRVRPWLRLKRLFLSNKVKPLPPPRPAKKKNRSVKGKMDLYDDISRLHHSLSGQSTSHELLNI